MSENDVSLDGLKYHNQPLGIYVTTLQDEKHVPASCAQPRVSGANDSHDDLRAKNQR